MKISIVSTLSIRIFTFMKQNPQVSATVTPEDFAEISRLAGKDNRSISAMVALLLHQAVKEKNRKRRGAKEDNTEHYASDSRPGNTR